MWHPVFADSGNLQVVFARLFPFQLGDKKLGMNADEAFFVAPSVHINRARQDAALTRSLPATRRKGKLWSDYQVVAPGFRNRLQLHERFVVEQGHDPPYSRCYADLMQTASFISPIRNEHFPGLLRNSVIWSMEKRRLLIDVESWEVMGFGPIWHPNDYSRGEHGFDVPGQEGCDSFGFLQLFLEGVKAGHYNKRACQQLMGNTMAVGVVGTLLMFMTACTVEVKTVKPVAKTEGPVKDSEHPY